MRIKYRLPATAKQGPCTIVGTSSTTETARDNALWEYNSMRAHDGQSPISGLPWGTTSERFGLGVTNAEKQDSGLDKNTCCQL